MVKNIVLCLDGSGNQIRAKRNTNVVRLYEMLNLGDPQGQVVYYDPGVGTFGSQGALLPITRRLSKLAGLAFGYGLRANLADAYTYLMHTYQPGDQIYIFGFSRGSFTARALAGMLNRAGLLRPGAENLVPYAIKVYARSKKHWTPDDWGQTAIFANLFSVRVAGEPSVPVHFLGLWDSVKAAGFLRSHVRWPDTRELPSVAQIRHAVSIDEKRRPYREYLVESKTPAKVQEVWFAGVHTDVGGTFPDDHRLADISLKWMVEHAVQAGLRVEPSVVRRYASVTADSARGKVHKMGWVWLLLTSRKRPIPPANARVHSSVRARMDAHGKYRPKVAGDTVVWDDPQWASPRDVKVNVTDPVLTDRPAIG